MTQFKIIIYAPHPSNALGVKVQHVVMDSLYFYLIVGFLAISVTVLCTLLHAGLFYDLIIRKSIAPSCPRKVSYSVHSGPYKNAGTHFKRLSVLVPNLKQFGIYYDDPRKVQEWKE